MTPRGDYYTLVNYYTLVIYFTIFERTIPFYIYG